MVFTFALQQRREMKLLLRGELVELVKGNDVVQFVKCNAKILMTTYSTGICQLTTDFNVEFSQP